jgi:hypothetical protein
VALLRALLVARGQGDGRLSVDELARGVRTYPEETERLLYELERMDYAAPVENSQGTLWLLTCDPQTKTLQPAFARFAIDPANTLAVRDPAGIGAWVGRGLAAEWITRPLARLFDPLPPG